MKLAEALSLRAELKSKINALGLRIRESAKIQEGDEPVEDVDELRKELDDCLNQIEDLIYRINMTNVHATIDGESLTRLIARRDVLSKRVPSWGISSIRLPPTIHVLARMRSDLSARWTSRNSTRRWTNTPNNSGSLT